MRNSVSSPSARRVLPFLALSVGSLAAALLGACGDDGRVCRVGADCPSGQCTTDGQCIVVGGEDGAVEADANTSGGSSGGSSGSSGGSSSGGSSSGGSSSSSGSSGVGCVPNQDGIITRDEVPMMAGLTGTFRIAAGAQVDLVGTVEGGVRKWNLGGELSGDQDVTVQTRPLDGRWFAAGFPTGDYTGLLSKSPLASLGVLRVDEDKLSLLGFVNDSEEQPAASAETNVVYDKAITTLQFPLQVGSTWSTEKAYGSGKLGGYSVPLYGRFHDTYSSVVDAEGALVTPLGIFPVLRIVTTFTRRTEIPGYNALLHADTKTVVFVSECVGTVAKITSTDGETATEFSAAAEVQRIAP